MLHEKLTALAQRRFENAAARRYALCSARALESHKLEHTARIEADGYRVEVLEVLPRHDGISFRARGFYNDKQIGFADDGSIDIETFTIINPPLLHPVSDGPIIIGKRAFAESPRDTIRLSLLDMVRRGKRDAEIIKGKIGRTTYTIFGGAADGFVESASTTYATAASGNSLVALTNSGVIGVGQYKSGTTFLIDEGFVLFDTSSVVGTVSSATLSLYGDFDGSTTDFTVNARQKTWGATLTTADWVAAASLSSQTLLATFATSGFTTSGYNNFTSDSAFISNINQSGTTDILLSSSRHESSTQQSGDEVVNFVEADFTGTSQDPKLVVEAAAASGASGKMLSLF